MVLPAPPAPPAPLQPPSGPTSPFQSPTCVSRLHISPGPASQLPGGTLSGLPPLCTSSQAGSRSLTVHHPGDPGWMEPGEVTLTALHLWPGEGTPARRGTQKRRSWLLPPLPGPGCLQRPLSMDPSLPRMLRSHHPRHERVSPRGTIRRHVPVSHRMKTQPAAKRAGKSQKCSSDGGCHTSGTANGHTTCPLLQTGPREKTNI